MAGAGLGAGWARCRQDAARCRGDGSDAEGEAVDQPIWQAKPTEGLIERRLGLKVFDRERFRRSVDRCRRRVAPAGRKYSGGLMSMANRCCAQKTCISILQSYTAEGRNRPTAVRDHHLNMPRCGPSLRPFVHSAAFWRLKRRCAGQCVSSLQVH